MKKVYETLDEAIAYYEKTKEEAKNYDLTMHPIVAMKVYEHEQLVIWLKELKELKKHK